MRFRFILGCSALAIGTSVVCSQSRASETITYTYDSLGRLIVAKSTGSVNNNETASYCYDDAGNRTYAKANAAGATVNCATIPTPAPSPTPTPGPSISIGNGSTTEGGVINFAVTMSAASSSSISVNYATATGTAGGADFTAKSGTLTFSAGQTSKTISVTTLDDIKPENTELFYVNLTNPTGGATIGDGQGTGTIYDDGDDGGCALC